MTTEAAGVAVAPPPTHPHTAPIRAPTFGRDVYNQQSLGFPLSSTIRQSKVLMVGAGGIGCELLKNLVLTGFGEIHVVDLDTIDLSNLNRQFLFRQEHIKKPKALVAKEAAEKFNPSVNIVAHHTDIKNSKFNVAWFRQFTLAFNALDNLEARRYVNKMCLRADIPLIESGTTGFKGQCQVIKKGVTACFDCSSKETPKTFAICTIRSTPSQPIHCIVWAKSFLMGEIFGESEDADTLYHKEDGEDAVELEELARETKALREIRELAGTEAFPQKLFDKVFNTDIQRLRSMEDMWQSRKPPEPLVYTDVHASSSDAIAIKAKLLRDGQKVWSLEENLVVFVDSLERLGKRMQDMKKDPSLTEAIITFDKDDEDTLDFVTASANIRSKIFGIEPKSRFDIKQMAGNIIPAIATTNAIVAGVAVLEAFKVIKGDYLHAKEVILSPFNDARLLSSDVPRPPNPQCAVCGVYETSAFVDLSRVTLKDLVDDFVRLQLGYGDKEFAIRMDKWLLYDVEETDHLSKKLTDLGITSESVLAVTDEDDDDPFVNICINIEESSEPLKDKPILESEETKKITIPRKPKKPAPLAGAVTEGTSNGTTEQNGTKDESNGTAVVASATAGTEKGTGKRLRIEDEDEAGAKVPTKRAKVSDDEEVVLVTSTSEQGAITIDDD